MRRTLILSALGSTTLLIGLGVGAALATADPVQPSPTATHSMMADCPMTYMVGMMSMMGSPMMGSPMMDEQVPDTETAHAGHHTEVRP